MQESQYLPMYCPHMNLSSCEVCAFIIHLVSHERVETFECGSLLESHSVRNEDVFVEWETSALLYYFSM